VRLRLGEALQQQLQTVGIAVTLESVETTVWSERVKTAADFDLTLLHGSQGPEANNMRMRFGTNGQQQVMGYSSPALDQLLQQGAVSTNLSARADAYFAAQAILAEDLPIAPLAEFVKVTIWREGITGWPWTEARGLVTFNEFSLVQRP